MQRVKSKIKMDCQSSKENSQEMFFQVYSYTDFTHFRTHPVKVEIV